MSLPILEVLGPIRTAILANSAIAPLLSTWESDPAVFTRRPVPDGAQYPLITVGPIVDRDGREDGINDHRPVVTLDVSVYGNVAAAGSADDHTRVVQTIAETIFSMFHQQRPITVDGYSVTQIMAAGPYPAPADDDQTIARRVRLTMRLRALFL